MNNQGKTIDSYVQLQKSWKDFNRKFPLLPTEIDPSTFENILNILQLSWSLTCNESVCFDLRHLATRLLYRLLDFLGLFQSLCDSDCLSENSTLDYHSFLREVLMNISSQLTAILPDDIDNKNLAFCVSNSSTAPILASAYLQHDSATRKHENLRCLAFEHQLFLAVCKQACRGTSTDPLNFVRCVKIALDAVFLDAECDFCTNFDSRCQNAVLSVVQAYWDNPFPLIADLACEIFTTFLDRWEKNCPQNLELLLEQLFEIYVHDFPWFVKGKYRILPILIGRCTEKQLVAYSENLMQLLALACSYNHIYQAASVVFKAAIDKLGLCKASTDVFQKWLQFTANCLRSQNGALRFAAMRHWIPSVLKSTQDAGLLLQYIQGPFVENSAWNSLENMDLSTLTSVELDTCHLKNENSIMSNEGEDRLLPHERELWAYVTVCTCGIRLGIMRDKNLNVDLLHAALRLTDCSVEALECLLMTGIEDMYCVLRFLKCDLNMTVDEPVFRKKLVKFLAQCLAFKQPDSEFCHHLFKFLYGQLFPGANFQRLSTALGLLNVLYGHNATADKPLSSCYGVEPVKIFLQLLEHSCGSIRSDVSHLLKTYFPWPLPIPYLPELLAQRVFRLCNSPKELNCEAGVTILDILIEKFAKNGYLISCDLTKFEASIRLVEPVNDCSQKWAELFLQLSESSFEILSKNVLLGAQDRSLHGFIKAMTCTLHLTPAGCVYTCDFLERIVQMTDKVLEFVLRIVGCSDDNPCPTFRDLDQSIGENIDPNYLKNEEVSIPVEHQLILACCWLTINDTSRLLVEVASRFLAENVRAEACAQSSAPLNNSGSVSVGVDSIKHIGDCLFRVLTQIRHWGAIEGCGEAFIRFCELCMMTGNAEQLRLIPHNLLSQALDLMSSVNLNISRRSLGFPLLMHCVLVVEYEQKQSSLLDLTFRRLIVLAKEPLPAQLDGFTDLPQVRAFNCLRMLCRSSQLGLGPLRFIGDIFHIALQAFECPFWPVRNAVTMLYSALFWRMFGHRELGFDLNLCSLSDFISLYEAIWSSCLCKLNEICGGPAERKKNLLDARLYPILALLKNLVATPNLRFEPARMREFCNLMRHLQLILLCAPDFRLRATVARVIVNLSFANSLPEIVCSTLTSLGNCVCNNTTSHNVQAGLLELVLAIFDRFKRECLGTTKTELFVKQHCCFEQILQTLKTVLHEKDRIPNVMLQRKLMAVIQLFEPSYLYAYKIRRNRYEIIANFYRQAGDLNSQDYSFLKTAAEGKFGVSVQSLALPRLTAHLRRSTIRRDGFLQELLEIVELCAEQRLAETCRLSAVYACFDAVQLARNEPVYMIRLFLCLLKLQDDELSDIRLAVRRAFPEGILSAFHRCFDELCFLDTLLTMLLPLDSDFKHLACLDHQTERFLFAQKDFNIFAEPVRRLDHVAALLLANRDVCAEQFNAAMFARQDMVESLVNSAQIAVKPEPHDNVDASGAIGSAHTRHSHRLGECEQVWLACYKLSLYLMIFPTRYVQDLVALCENNCLVNARLMTVFAVPE